MRTSTLSSSLSRCLMLSASSGERRVPRALPGLGAERLRAAASSACLAAWRAAHGAAPRMPSLRFPPASVTSAFFDFRAAGGATDFRAAGGATDLRGAGGATDLRGADGNGWPAAGATDLRAAEEGRMD